MEINWHNFVGAENENMQDLAPDENDSGPMPGKPKFPWDWKKLPNDLKPKDTRKFDGAHPGSIRPPLIRKKNFWEFI